MKKLFWVVLCLVCVMQTQVSSAAPVKKKVVVKHPAAKTVARKATVSKTPVKRPVANMASVVTPEMLQLYQQGSQAFEQHRLEDAQRDMEKLLAKLSETNPMRGNVLSILGQIQQNHMNYEKSEELLEQSIAANEKIFGKNAMQLAPTLAILAHQYFWFGKIEPAKRLADRAAQIQQFNNQSNPQTNHLLTLLNEYMAVVEPTPDYTNHLGDKITHWRPGQNPVIVYIPSAESIDAWRPQNIDLLKSSFMAWQSLLNNKIQFAFTDNPNLYDVQVNWLDRPIGYQTEELHEMGRNVLKMKDENIVKLDLEFSLKSKNGFVVPERQLHTIMLHEIGHMLGLLGHSNNPTDVMFSVPHTIQFSDRDVRTVQTLYSIPPAISNPIGIHLSQYQVFDEISTRAGSAFNNRDYANAYNMYGQALNVYPQHNYTRFLFGYSAMQLQRLDEAAQNCEVASYAPSNFQYDAYECVATSLYNSVVPAINAGQGNNPDVQQRIAKARHFYQLAMQKPNLDINRRNSLQQFLINTDQQPRLGRQQWQISPGPGFGNPTAADPNYHVWGLNN